MKFTPVVPAYFAITMAINVVCARSVHECTGSTISSRSHHASIVNKYLKLWKGDLSLVDQTFDPEITFNADRFPSSSGTGSAPLTITTSEEFGAFVNASRQGFEKYGFDAFYWLGEGNRVAIRWHLDSVIGNYTRFPISLKPGDSLTYNGTDVLTLNPCTGLVNQVDSAQDLLTLFHNLGFTTIPV
ncbi:hypothetical protein OIDMADRAFT_25981 [Oidiodendron maius Zn]|uniref:SnoaL-like domain-containing protein n=1 Tax=Oidiodendron maius (strain Zn) TaxID=913774 RepID=A0A0C3D2D8_OIDMZ|nr:hypothetical protein OIDMADRAFT_25981 [Oidiodendron maius Zn]